MATLLPIHNDRGTALSLYRSVLDEIRTGKPMPAEHFIAYLSIMDQRMGHVNGRAGYGLLVSRMIAEWIKYNTHGLFMVVPVVDVTEVE